MILAKHMSTSVLFTWLFLTALGCSRSSDSDDGVNTPNRDRSPTSNDEYPDDGNRPTANPSQDPGVTIRGRSLQIVKKPNSSDLSFGVVYSLAADPDGMTWLITFKTNITDAELKLLPETMYWNVHYRLGEKPRISAEDAKNFTIQKNNIRLGQIKVTGPRKILSHILLMQKDGFLMFGTSPSETLTSPKFVLDLGSLCRQSPQYFSNLTNEKTCDQIKVEDVGLN